VYLEIGAAELERLMSANGEIEEISTVVEGGFQETDAGNVQSKREYPSLELFGLTASYGPVTILGLGVGSTHPILKIKDTIKLSVGPCLTG
jgi:hypothetical protein